MAKKKEPPNYRRSVSCGTCKHGQWGYEGELTCTKYPDDWKHKDGHINDSAGLCDDYEAPEVKGEPQR
jgi:hypothetical protein